MTLGVLPVVQAANPVVIRIATQPVTTIAAGFSGVNAPQPRNGVAYFDPKFIAAVTPIKPAWVRYPGGTVSLAFDWSTGHMNTEWVNYWRFRLFSGCRSKIQTAAMEVDRVDGLGRPLFQQLHGQPPRQRNPNGAGCQTYGLNVVEWELGNEAKLPIDSRIADGRELCCLVQRLLQRYNNWRSLCHGRIVPSGVVPGTTG